MRYHSNLHLLLPDGRMIKGRIKHLLHCLLLFFSVISLTILIKSFTQAKVAADGEDPSSFNPWMKYGYVGCSILYAFRFLVFLPFPQVLLNFIGLTFYNVFPGKVMLKSSTLLTPLICIRIVTRGDFPQLVRENVARNMARCIEAGLDNFVIEVVTDKPIGLPSHRRIREIVVPTDYTTKTGSLYKARALQYCLEDRVNILADNDWVVHLDEETLLTKNSIRGILNFVLDGKYEFGQGLITYANEKVVNWITTLADTIRVADDMGKLRAQFNIFHKPVLSWKGSFIVAQVGAERNVSFEGGVNGSIAEDCYFAMRAYMEGYSFSFVDGEMWEKSPFSIWDFIQQRKRWIQGISLVVHAPEIPLRYKFWIGVSLYAWISMPLSCSNLILGALFPIPTPFFLDLLCSFIGAVNIYMYLFGVIKSFSLYKFGVFRFIGCLFASVCIIPFTIMLENTAVILALFSNKKKFYIVKKEFKPLLSSSA